MGEEHVAFKIPDIPKEKVLIEAVKRNALYGKQLTRDEKRSLAIPLYERGHTQEEIAEILAVDQSTNSTP